MNIHIDFEAVRVEIEFDAESGEFTAFNDDLQVMAIADSEREARDRFRDALGAMVVRELSLGNPLPQALTTRVRELATA